MPKAAAIDAATLLAPKGQGTAAPGGLGRGQTASETLVDLNFKVPDSFRQEFKQLALDAKLKNVQLLSRMLDAYKREHGVA